MPAFGHEMMLLGLAGILGVMVSLGYRLTNTEIVHSQAFMQALVVTSCTVSMIMLATNDLASAFVIVGVLGIVSFRTVMRNTREFVFLLLALAAGMSAGANRWEIALAGTAVVLLIAICLHHADYGRHAARAFLVKVQAATGDLRSVDGLLEGCCARVRRIGAAKVTAFDGVLTFEVLLPEGAGSQDLIEMLLAELVGAEVTVTSGRNKAEQNN